MTALAEIRISLPGYMRLFFGYRFNDDAGAPKESIELTAAARSGLRSTTIATSTKLAAEIRQASAAVMAWA